jgi:hypothetical protein
MTITAMTLAMISGSKSKNIPRITSSSNPISASLPVLAGCCIFDAINGGVADPYEKCHSGVLKQHKAYYAPKPEPPCHIPSYLNYRLPREAASVNPSLSQPFLISYPIELTEEVAGAIRAVSRVRQLFFFAQEKNAPRLERFTQEAFSKDRKLPTRSATQ